MGSASPHAFQCRLGDHRPIPSRSQLFEPPCDPFFALMRQIQTAWHRHGRKPSKSCSVLQGMGQRDAVSQGLPCTPDVHCREVPVKGGCQAEIRLPLGKGSGDGLKKPSPVSLGRKLRPLRRRGSSSCLTAPFPSCGRPSRVLGAGCRVTGRVQTGQGAGETGAWLLPPSPTRRLEGLISGSQVLIVSSQSKAPSFPRHALISPWRLQGETRRKWTFFS